MPVKFSNNATTTLSANVSSGATSFTVVSSSSFPSLTASDWTYVSLDNEVVRVSAISGNTFTCASVTTSHLAGEGAEIRMTAELLNDFATDTESTGTSVSMAIALG